MHPIAQQPSQLRKDHPVDAPVVDLVQRSDAPRFVLQLEEHLVHERYRRRRVDQGNGDGRFRGQETLPLEQDARETTGERINE